MAKPIPGQPMIPGAPGWEHSLKRIGNMYKIFRAQVEAIKYTDKGLEVIFTVQEDVYNLMSRYAHVDSVISQNIWRPDNEMERG